MAGAGSKCPLEVRVRRVPGAPVVAARLWLWGGSRLEETPGLGLLTGRLLSEGTRRRDYRAISREAEDRGMLVQSYASTDALGVSIEALAVDWPRVLDWIVELTLEPTFPEDRQQWSCRQAAAELESLYDQGDFRALWTFLDQIYHPHPYGRPALGHPRSLATITPDDCVALHRRALAWGGCLVVAGDVDEGQVGGRLESLLADWPVAPEARPEVPQPVGRGETRTTVAIPPGDQAHLHLGHHTLCRTDPDLPALDVLAIILGAGSSLSGRLPLRIRDEEGLAYQVDVTATGGAGLDPGRLGIYVGTSPSTVDRAEGLVREELRRLLDDGVTDAELTDAKAFLVGRDPFRRETARQWADLMAESALYGLPVDDPDWVARTVATLDRGDLARVAERWLRPDDLRVTVGLPDSKTG